MRHGEKQANRVVEEAREQLSVGHRVYSVVVELASARAGVADDLSTVIEDVEEVGWRLDRTGTVSVGTSARPQVLLIFRPA